MGLYRCSKSCGLKCKGGQLINICRGGKYQQIFLDRIRTDPDHREPEEEEQERQDTDSRRRVRDRRGTMEVVNKEAGGYDDLHRMMFSVSCVRRDLQAMLMNSSRSSAIRPAPERPWLNTQRW